jgi:prepilin-type N-terminal cleavage/methylation domain-containing protein
MIKIRKYKRQIHNDNSGFSLLELLVSIVILAIVMIPLMNSFVQAMKINQKSEKLLNHNNVTSNIIEHMKSMDLDQLLVQYAGQRVYYDAAAGVYTTNPAAQEEGIYYFSVEDIAEEDVSYDAIVKVSADTYRYEETDVNHNGILMNNYAMPDIITVDSNLNAMFFAHMYRDSVTRKLSAADDPLVTTDKSIDQIVLDYFREAANDYADEQFRAYSAAYAQYRQELMAYQNGDTDVAPVEPTRSSILPEDPQYPIYGNPDYCQENVIQTYIDRSFEILLSDVEASVGHYKSTANYQVTYHCNWPAGLSIEEGILSFHLESKNYGRQIVNLYLYYEIFHQGLIAYQPDTIRITNNTGRSVNFFIVKQDTVVPSSSIRFFRFGSGDTNIYTNMLDHEVKEYTINAVTGEELAVDETTNQVTVNNDIIVSQKTNRIFLVEVRLYPHTDGAIGTKYQSEELYQLSSNRKD